MDFDIFRRPVSFLKNSITEKIPENALRDYETWWDAEGEAISETVDQAGTPWLRMFDKLGHRSDEIIFPAGYRAMLLKGYQSGIIRSIFEQDSLVPSYLLGYIACFYDVGVYCPYTVSLSTALPLDKYGEAYVKDRYLPLMQRTDERVWQGATWITEVKGGSDLGTSVETIARHLGDHWQLTGEKYFCSNLGAELAVVAARPEMAPQGVRGLSLFLLPKHRTDGSLNYCVRRIKDKIGTRSVPTGEVELKQSEAYLLGRAEWGIYLILEVLNASRVANCIGSVALAQRAYADALHFAEERIAFGKPLIEHPLMRRQFVERATQIDNAFALAWEAVKRLEEVWRETPPYSDRFHLFRLLTHLAKFWTAELAVQMAKWSMEVHGGVGTLAEFGIERWLRDAMILDIWEGPPHRQILDGLEVMERKGAHRLLFEHLGRCTKVDPRRLKAMAERVETHLHLPSPEKESQAERIFCELAAFAADCLAQMHP